MDNKQKYWVTGHLLNETQCLCHVWHKKRDKANHT